MRIGRSIVSGMRSRAIRASAILYGLFAFAGALVVRVQFDDSESRTIFVLEIGPTVLALILYGSVVRLTRPIGRIAIDLRRGRFVVHGSPREAIVTIGLMFIAALTSGIGGGVFPDEFSVDQPTMIIVLGVACAFALVDAPTVRMSPAGIAVYGLRRQRLVAWSDIAPAGAVVDRPVRARRVTLLLRDDPDAVRWTRSIDISALRLDADGRALASVINYYVEHPDAASRIGSRDEFARLTAGPPLPAGEPVVMSAPA